MIRKRDVTFNMINIEEKNLTSKLTRALLELEQPQKDCSMDAESETASLENKGQPFLIYCSVEVYVVY